MKRREVLRNLGLGVTAGLALPWLSSCSDDESGPEVKYSGVVGIIGAGAAGLFVADYLMSKGVKVKIFEASGQIGGRARTLPITDPMFAELLADFPIELGADRIIGKDSAFGKIVRVPVIDFRGSTSNAADSYIINNEHKTLAEIQADSGLAADFAELENFKNNILPTYTGGDSVQAAAGISSQMEGVLNSWLGNAYGTSSDRISASALGESLLQSEHDGKEYTLNNSPIGSILGSRFNKAVKKVLLNQAIQTINHSGERISLTIKNPISEEITSEEVDKLVITVPVSILKAGDITFNPPLPGSKTSALSKIGMDASIRMYIEFRKNNFLGENPGFIFGGTECPSYFLAGAGRSETNRTLSVTINGPKAETLSALTDLQKVDQILAELDAVYDGAASEFIRKTVAGDTIYVVKDWKLDPYIKGGSSYPLVGGSSTDRIDLAEPINSKLFFAGEATFYRDDDNDEESKFGEFGTISGALLSGKRAAREVVISILEENAS